MKTKSIFLLFLLGMSFMCCQQNHSGILGFGKEPVDYVNNRIGNISMLSVPTSPVTHWPNSMVRMIPAHTEFTTDRLHGLPLNVPSHRQGDVLYLMPYCGADSLTPDPDYRYDHEISTPYQYSVFLEDHAITARFAPAARSGVFTFTFEKNGARYVMLRTARSEGELQAEGKVMSGYENYHGAKHYFYLEFEQTPVETGLLDTSSYISGQKTCYAEFEKGTKEVRLRYGVSYISEEQAQKNMENEIWGFDIEPLAKAARAEWNKTLGKIQVEGGSEDQKTVFYTSLYRAHERMVNISENGKYFCGFDGQIHDDEGIPFWTDDRVGDTYYALHPLQIILNPKKQEEKLVSYLRMYEHSEEQWMPDAPCVFGDAHSVNGNHAAVMFADALSKGLKFDVEKAFEGMKNTVLNETMLPWQRAPLTALDDFYHQQGWFPALQPGEKETEPLVHSLEKRNAVAVTQAASYDDWCIAQMAKSLGKEEEYEFFLNRALNYRNLFNQETGFFHPKDKHGKFIEPFVYLSSGSNDYYDKNNAWTYLWNVHHNIADLIQLLGGNQPFIDKLDQFFDEDLKTSNRQDDAAFPGATANVGQFVMGNEPGFHIPYLYNYAGEPWKTQKRIRMLLESRFRDDLMGIPGDEAGGGMTAFVVFSYLGFYPVSPGIPVYTIGSPVFTRASIRMDHGRTFTVEARNSSRDNKYIQSATLNGRVLNRTWFTHADLVNGGTLVFIMGDRPNYQWGIDSPPSSAPDMHGK